LPKSETFIPFSRPSIDQQDIDEVVECLKSGWITTGPRVAKFESGLADFFDEKLVLTVSSATAGLHLTLIALDLNPGDEIITCSMTFAATVNTIVHVGCKPVFVDIEESTYNIEVGALERAISERTKAIMPVHFAGLPIDMGPLYATAEKYNLRVIEDAAHAIGAAYDNSLIGSFGDTQVFSFHPNKNITTGEGGCVVLRDQTEYERIQHLLFHGIEKSMTVPQNRYSGQSYDIATPGYKYNMMDIQAALGVHQLPRLPQFIDRREKLAHRYLDKLKNWPEITLPQPALKGQRHAWHLFAPLLVPEAAGMNRNNFISRMHEENIGVGLHYPAVHTFSYYREHPDIESSNLPNTEKVADRIFSLPLHPDLPEDEQDYVITTMRKIFDRY
jgi:dTDP-4-amino-4,6-dideoxygalactose transaminase